MIALIACLNLFAAGLLAGEELTIRFGVRGPLSRLAPQPGIQLRQGLIRPLRVLVPSILGIALLTGGAVAVIGGGGERMWLRCAGVAALAVFITVTLAGTVPINQAVMSWDPAAPPQGWTGLIARWERLDSVRTALAVAAFALFLAAAVLPSSA